jgi:methyltransferase-like protein
VLPPPSDPCYRSDLQSALKGASGEDFIKQEQLLDFMRMRMYRETLLCRAEREVHRDFSAEQFRRLLFASETASSPGEGAGAKVFTLPGGIKMETAHAGTIALMEQLEAAWPRALSLAELEPGLAEKGFTLDHQGVALVTRLAISKMIELRAWQAPLAAEISTRPRVSASARQEAHTRDHATTLLHTTLQLEDAMVRSFLILLDGTRDRRALFEALQAEFPGMPAEQLKQGIEPNLQLLYCAGMLEA